MYQIHGLYFKTSRPGSRVIGHEWQDLTKGEFLEKKKAVESGMKRQRTVADVSAEQEAPVI